MSNRREALIAARLGGDNEYLGYVSTGLLSLYDGIKNTRNGHSDTTATWHDLVNNKDLTINDSAEINNKYITVNGFDGIYSTDTSTSFGTQVKTIEIVYSLKENAPACCVLNLGGGGASGIYKTNIGALSLGNNYSMFAVNNDMSSSVHSYSIYAASSGGIQKAYQDNISLAPIGIATWPNEAGKWGVGAYGNVQNRLYGNVYCVRLYSRELTADERLTNYHNDVRRFRLQRV